MAWPVFDDLKDWMQDQRARSSGKTALAGAIRYGLARLKKLWRLDDILPSEVMGAETELFSEPDGFLTGLSSVRLKRYKLRPHQRPRLFVSVRLKKDLQIAARDAPFFPDFMSTQVAISEPHGDCARIELKAVGNFINC